MNKSEKITKMKTNFSGERDLEKTLNGLPKGNPYSVPEGYFNAFPQKISERIARENSERIAVSSGKGRFGYSYLAYAASVALVIGLGYVGLKMDFNHSEIGSEASAIAHNPTAGVYVDFDEASLMQTLHEDSRVPKPTVGETDHRDEMIQYLVDENVDYTILIEKK